MKLSDNIIDKLQELKGINLDIAYRIFREMKLDVKRTGFSENLVALLLDKDLPKNDKGMDFKGLFEVKEVKVKFNKRDNKMTTRGDTSISSYLSYEENFFESNIWNKSNKILIICVNENRNIIDVRFFDGEKYSLTMEQDYEKIKVFKNLCRKENEILVFKTGRNSIMLKGNTAIDMSESILSDDIPEINNQDFFIRELFQNKFSSYQEKIKSIFESITILMDSLSILELEKIKELAENKIKESMGFDIFSGDELNF